MKKAELTKSELEHIKEIISLSEKKPKQVKDSATESGWLSKLMHFFKVLFKGYSQMYLIDFHLSSGNIIMFKIFEKDGGFRYKGKQYLFDDVGRKYNLSLKLWEYTFHEGISIPIRQEFDTNEIRKGIDASRISEQVSLSLNPVVLEKALKAKFAEGILAGADLTKKLNTFTIILIVVGLICLVHFLLFMQKSGMLAQVKLF